MSTDPWAFGADSRNDRPPNPLPLDVSESHAHPRTAQQFAYEVLRHAIIHGALAPGTRLGQSQLAQQLRLSTTPVREALRRLASEELVRIDAHRGAIVRGLDREELSEIYRLRLVLEPMATRRAVEFITAEDLALAEEFCTRMDDHSDISTWSELNREFHAIFARAARSPRLTEILRGLRDSATPYVSWSMAMHPDFPVTANRQHRELLKACRERDGERAAEIEEQHLRSTLAAIMAEHPASAEEV